MCCPERIRFSAPSVPASFRKSFPKFLPDVYGGVRNSRGLVLFWRQPESLKFFVLKEARPQAANFVAAKDQRSSWTCRRPICRWPDKEAFCPVACRILPQDAQGCHAIWPFRQQPTSNRHWESAIKRFPLHRLPAPACEGNRWGTPQARRDVC